jgi:hypothetical protein
VAIEIFIQLERHGCWSKTRFTRYVTCCSLTLVSIVYIKYSGDLANALRNRTTIEFGIFYSMYEWFNQVYLEDKKNGFKTQEFINVSYIFI